MLPAPTASLPGGVRIQPVSYDYDLGSSTSIAAVSALLTQGTGTKYPRAVTVSASTSAYAVTGIILTHLATIPSGTGLAYLPNATIKTDSGYQTFNEPCLCYLSSATVKVWGLHTLSVLATITLPSGTYVGLTVDGDAYLVACTATQARRVTYDGTQASYVSGMFSADVAAHGADVASLSSGGTLASTAGWSQSLGSGGSGLTWTGTHFVVGNRTANTISWYLPNSAAVAFSCTYYEGHATTPYEVLRLAWDGQDLWMTDDTSRLWKVMVRDNLTPVSAWPAVDPTLFPSVAGCFEHFGFNPPTTPDWSSDGRTPQAIVDTKFSKLHDMGVTWLRWHPKNNVAPSSALLSAWAADWTTCSLDFTGMEAILRKADALGINVFLLTQTESVPFSDADFPTWATNHVHYATRVAQFVDSLDLGIQVIHEPQNEANQQYDHYGWSGRGMTYANTAAYACDYADAIHAAVPTALVCNPSISYNGASWPSVWLEAFLAAGLFPKLDALTTHSYVTAIWPSQEPHVIGGSGIGVITQLQWYAERGGCPDLPILIGEYGFEADSPTYFLDEANAGLEHPNVASMMVYMLDGSTYDWGLYNFSTMTPKASYTSLAAWGNDTAKMAYAQGKERHRLARQTGYTAGDGALSVAVAGEITARIVRVTVWPTGADAADTATLLTTTPADDLIVPVPIVLDPPPPPSVPHGGGISAVLTPNGMEARLVPVRYHESSCQAQVGSRDATVDIGRPSASVYSRLLYADLVLWGRRGPFWRGVVESCERDGTLHLVGPHSVLGGQRCAEVASSTSLAAQVDSGLDAAPAWLIANDAAHRSYVGDPSVTLTAQALAEEDGATRVSNALKYSLWEYGWYYERLAGSYQCLPHWAAPPTTLAYIIYLSPADAETLSGMGLEGMADSVRVDYSTASRTDVLDTDRTHYLVGTTRSRWQKLSPSGCVNVTDAGLVGTAYLAINAHPFSGTVSTSRITLASGAAAYLPHIRPGSLARVVGLPSGPTVLRINECTVQGEHAASVGLGQSSGRLDTLLAKFGG